MKFKKYAWAPQGFILSNYGYNRHFSAVLSNFRRMDWCDVDDTVIYISELECQWWQTIGFQ